MVAALFTARFGNRGYLTKDMRLKLLIMLIPFLLVGCAPLETAAGSGMTATPVEDIAIEFKRLRAVKGHFDGGDWNVDVDEWMGLKHQLMIELGSCLGRGEYSESEVIRLLDSPDAIAREGDEFFDLVSDQAEFQGPVTGPYQLMIYYWRGTHDFLYFVSQDGAIVSSGWWYAGE